jgi:predicted carbohydrate-binding protein with CBM5 and CBM33 domain
MPPSHRHHWAHRAQAVRPGTVVRIALGAAVLALPLLAAGTAAHAHGAPTTPVSRTFACSPEGSAVNTAVCRAALAASGGALENWDYLHLADVRGRDRSAVPNGQLCSGGLADFRGLDLPRTDWPTTTVAAGAAFTMRYITTIPHQGTFKLHVTKDGFDPSQPLRWSDLESQPFMTVTNPAVTGGSYQLTGTLPTGKTGRHLIYTIWQNSDTPDTYYSCSDVVFGKPGPGNPPAPGGGAGEGAGAGSGAAGAGAGAGSGAAAEGGAGATVGTRSEATTDARAGATASARPEATGTTYAAAGQAPTAGDDDESLAARLTSSRTGIVAMTVVAFTAVGAGFLTYLRRHL